ncbi:MAG TPA: Lrp/AsnC ligand binding domain-containing protein, partial [Anaerolineae bacterium]
IIRMVLTGPNLARFTESVKHMHEVLECHRLTGSDSIYLKVMVPSINHLEAVINNLLQYGETTTTLVLSSTVNRRVIEHGPEEPLDAPVP